MNRLITTTVALALSAVMSPAFALQRDLPSVPGWAGAGDKLLLDPLRQPIQTQALASPMSEDSASGRPLAAERQGELLVSHKSKGRQHRYVKPHKRKHHRHPRRGHRYDHGHRRYYDHYDRHDYYDRHDHYYRPSYWYDDYYHGLGLGVILHLDG
ncbi:MAG: hypothetical protein PVI91_17980 [Gammaproteobacteria bacterium]|jgi:hypothetical protein